MRIALVLLPLAGTVACTIGVPIEPAHDDAGEGEGAAEGEGEGAPGEGEGAPGEGEGEGEGALAGEGEGEGEGAPVDSSPLSARSAGEVCGTWRAYASFQGTEWTPLGDGSDMCDVGTLDAGAQDAAVNRVTLYRWLAGLPPVALEPTLVAQEQACANVENGLGHLDHFPTDAAPCFTSDGAAGAGSSNLAMGTDTTYSVDLFVDDSGVSSMGHRRWVLNPTASVTAFGHKGAFTCMYSFSGGGSADPDFLSWPPAGPVPVDAATGRFWFATSKHDTTNAVIEVAVDGGAFAPVTYDVLPYGYGTMANNLAFDVPGHSSFDLAVDGRAVTVRVSGLGDGAVLTYTTRYVACP